MITTSTRTGRFSIGEYLRRKDVPSLHVDVPSLHMQVVHDCPCATKAATSGHPPWPRSGCCLRHQPWKCQPLAAWSIDHPARGKMHLGTMQQLIKTPCFTHGNQGQLSCQVPLPCKKERNMRHPQRKVKTLMMSVASKQLCFHITVEQQLLRSSLPFSKSFAYVLIPAELGIGKHRMD